MKYIVPEINISKFSVENIVTLSGAGKGNNAIDEALTSVGGGAKGSVNTTLNDWVAAN